MSVALRVCSDVFSLMENVKSPASKLTFNINICSVTENLMPSISTPLFFFFQVNEESKLCLALVLSDVSLSSSDVSGSS